MRAVRGRQLTIRFKLYIIRLIQMYKDRRMIFDNTYSIDYYQEVSSVRVSRVLRIKVGLRGSSYEYFLIY